MNRRKFQKIALKSAVISFFPSPFYHFSLKKYKPLKPGDTIGLIAPAGKINQDRIEKASNNLKSLGFKVKYNKSILEVKGYLAGSDSRRLKELHAMYEDPAIAGIWCVRGGYGATRILDQLDFSLIKKNPKPLLGYSDITALLNTIYQKTGSPCFHAPVGSSSFTNYTKEHLAPIFGLNEPHLINLASQNEKEGLNKQVYKSFQINPGTAQGKLAGGNLSLLVSLIGTKHQVRTTNRIVFIEDIGEEPYRVDRMLTQLLSAGFFEKAKAVVLGIFAGCHRKNEIDLTLAEVITDRIKPLKIPSVYGFSFGHIDNQCTFPIGAAAEFNANNMSIKILQDNY